MTSRKVWVEVALNGPWGRARQPLIPITTGEIIAEGVAAARAGAAVVHFHGYDEATGRQKDDWEIYAQIIEGIRSQVDAIVYPTIPLAGAGLGDEPIGASARYRHLDELGRRGLLEWAVVDPGSVNFSRNDAIRRAESGFTRLGAALAASVSGLPTPVYRFMFSDEFAWGFPPEIYGLEAHLALLRAVAPGAPWMIAGLGVNVEPLIAAAVAHGGHVRVGLEDAWFGCEHPNIQLVETAIQNIRAAGGEPASVAEVRHAGRPTRSSV